MKKLLLTMALLAAASTTPLAVQAQSATGGAGGVCRGHPASASTKGASGRRLAACEPCLAHPAHTNKRCERACWGP